MIDDYGITATAGSKLVPASVGFLVSIIFVVISSWFAWREVEYLMYGQVATATITGTESRSVRRRQFWVVGPRKTFDLVDYRYMFLDPKTTKARKEHCEVSADLSVGPTTVAVQYIPGRAFASRIDGQWAKKWIVVFGIGMSVCLVSGIWLHFNLRNHKRRVAYQDALAP